MKRSDASFDQSPGLPSSSTGVTREGLVYDVEQAVLAKGMTRRGFLKVSALAGATLVMAPSGGSLLTPRSAQAAQEFSFAIIADSHTMGPKNQLMKTRLETAIREVNNLTPAPDFVIYMGDAIHDGSPEQFKFFEEIMSGLKAPVRYVAGEHDWYLDMGEYYTRNLIKQPTPYYSFNHKGTHVMVLNGINFNDFWTSRRLTPQERMDIAGTLNDPRPGPFLLGRTQLDWMEKDLSDVAKDTPILVFTHPPLYHYYRPWNFWTQDAPDAQQLLKPFRTVQIFHGHVHQVVRNQIDNLKFFGNVSTSWPHPYPATYHTLNLSGQMPRANPALPFDGLGWSQDRVASNGQVTHRDVLWTLNPPKV